MPKIKTTPYESIARIANEDLRQVAIQFVEWLEEIGTTPYNYSRHAYNCKHKGKSVYLFAVLPSDPNTPADTLRITLEAPLPQELDLYLKTLSIEKRKPYKDAIVTKCGPCAHYPKTCRGLFSYGVIDGVKYDNMCHFFRFTYTNPSPEQFEIIKTIIKMRIAFIESHGTAARPKFAESMTKFTQIDNKRILLISAPQGMNEREMGENLFDGTYKTNYCTGKPGDIVFQVDERVTASAYSFVTANDCTAVNNGRIPRKWTLYGSNSTNGGWVALDTQASDRFIAYNYSELAFEIDKPSEYQYYKLTPEGEGIYQFSQIHLYTK